MTYYAIKVLLSAVIIVVVSEVAKRSTFIGGIVASLPLVSLLAMIWLYLDTGDTVRISQLSLSIFWLVLPSLGLFLLLPWLLHRGMGFVSSLSISIAVTALLYFGMVFFLKRIGINL